MPRRRKPLRSNAAKQREWDRRTLARRLVDPAHAPVAAARLAKQRRQESEWQQAREAVIWRSRGLCEANWQGVCPPGPHAGEHVHHRRLRSQGGTHDVENLLHLCRIVHDHAHNVDRVGAEQRGIIVRA